MWGHYTGAMPSVKPLCQTCEKLVLPGSGSYTRRARAKPINLKAGGLSIEGTL